MIFLAQVRRRQFPIFLVQESQELQLIDRRSGVVVGALAQLAQNVVIDFEIFLIGDGAEPLQQTILA